MNDQRRERLEDAWDETALELLMDDYAEIAGSELYDEYCSDLEIGNVEDLPAELDESCQEMIHASFTAESKAKKNPLNPALSYVYKAAMVVLAIFGATTVLVVSVDALRVPVLNFFLTQEERYTILSSAESNDLTGSENINDIRGYIPKDYKIVYETYYGQGYYNLRYQNEAGNVISIRTGEGDVQLYADTEDASCEQIEMNGQSALFIQKNGLRIVLQKSDPQAIVDFFAEALDENEFFRIAMFLSEM